MIVLLIVLTGIELGPIYGICAYLSPLKSYRFPTHTNNYKNVPYHDCFSSKHSKIV